MPVARAGEQSVTGSSPFARSAQEQRESALGLARFKLSQGQMDQALAITHQFDLALSEIEPMSGKQLPSVELDTA
jgi:hypothetical protein